MTPAVFLDRDGTLIEEKKYLHRPEQVAYFPGVIHALKRLAESGFALFMVTNQSGVGRGYFSMGDVDAVHARISADLAREGVRFAEIYVAPEAPDQPSRGRKPSPQFLLDAQARHRIALDQSYMVGDKLIDLECGWNAGVRESILVRTGYGHEVASSAGERLRNTRIVTDLPEAVEHIMRGRKP